MDNSTPQSKSNTNTTKSLNNSKNKNQQLNHNIDTECKDLCIQIFKLNLSSTRIIAELQKRKLNTSGKLPEHRSQLIKYINGEYTITHFDNIINPENTDYKSKLSERIPFCKPIKFSGAIHENVDSFNHKYNKASTINGCSDEQKLLFLSIYLQDTA